MTNTDVTPGAGPASVVRWARRRLTGGLAPIVGILAVICVALAARQPDFFAPVSLLAFLKTAAPLIILAAGQYFVIVSGEFDLSVGSLVTAEVVIAARLIDNEPGRTWPVVAVLFAVGLLVGLVNGVVTTALRVPSFITTLAMYLILVGAVFLWTGGSPRGGLTEQFRLLGRRGWENVPVVEVVPYAVVLLLAIGVAAVLLMRSDFGRTLVAVGDNPRTAELAGARVGWTKTIAFLLSGVSAAVAAILLGGFAGVSGNVGQGLEFAAITAVVLGGVALGGGRGSVVGAMLGALTLKLLFTLFNFYAVSGAAETVAQGVIIVAAVAIANLRRR